MAQPALEYWLIAIPGEKTPEQSFTQHKQATAKYSENWRFCVPDLKVGNIDQLVALTDDLAKIDAYCESVTNRVASYLCEIGEKQVSTDILKAGDKDLSQYLRHFQWDASKYPVKQPLKTIVEVLNKHVSQIEADLKTKSQGFNQLKNNLAGLMRKKTGSLLTRNVGELVRKEHFVLNSEYLVTLLVVVPRASYHDWQVKYAGLIEYVVPHSSECVEEDTDHGLFTVTVFQRFVEDFKLKCREHRFVVKDFTYDEEALRQSVHELEQLKVDKTRQFSPLFLWLKVNFGEAFTAWLHIKALRVFVESVLRFGLPVNFACILMQPKPKSERHLRDTMRSLYGHLDGVADAGVAGDFEMPGMAAGLADYYPYVFYPIYFQYPVISQVANER